MHRFGVRAFAGRSRHVVAMATASATQRRWNTTEQQVEGERGAPPAADVKLPEGVDPSRITRDHVWGLYNEGNLFALTVPELQGFLSSQGIDVDRAAKKSAMVRQIEGLMAKSQPSIVKPQEDTVATITAAAAGQTGAGVSAGHSMAAAASGVEFEDEPSSTADELFNMKDVYGDWGAQSGFEDRKGLGFMSISPWGLRDREQDTPLSCRAFQLLHNNVTSDVALAKLNPARLPGCDKIREAFSPVALAPDDANRLNFRKGYQWCATNLWNMNLDGEINIGAGKALYFRAVAKHNRYVLPLFTCQEHLERAHPYSWFAIAHESNKQPIEDLAQRLGMDLTQDETTSYKVMVRRPKDFLDVELNNQLQVTLVQKPWDRILCTHFLRNKMPDLRFLIRARRPIKKRVADAYLDTPILKLTSDSVMSVLSPELGDVGYCAERAIRKWTKTLDSGVRLQLVETRRTPLICTRAGDEGERLEYELVANIPQQVERDDLSALCDDLWTKGMEFATALEDGMVELGANTMDALSKSLGEQA